MVEVIPAVLPKNHDELEGALARLRGVSNWVQIDLVDGEFVPGAEPTWPFSESSHLPEILSGDEGLPYWQDFQYEFDLMVTRPEEVVEDVIQAGASRVVVHLSSTNKLDTVFDVLERTQTEVVIAFSRSDDIEDIAPYISRLAAVQIMGIARIGEQGQSFDERALEDIRAIKDRFPELLVQVDGAVDESTIARFREAGAERFISGSAILESDDPHATVNELRERT